MRDTVRARSSTSRSARTSPSWYRAGALPARELARSSASSACSACTWRATAAPGTSADGVRPRLPGARGRRLRAPLAGLGAGVAGDVRDPALRQRGAEAGVAAPDGRRRGDRLLRPDRAGLRLRPRRRCAPGRAATAATGCSTAPRCGSPTARSPTSPWSGRAPTTASAASSSRPTRPASRAPEIKRKLSLRASVTSSWSSTASGCPPTPCCPRRAGLRGPLSCLNEARFGIVFGALGAARDCLETAIAYAGDAGAVRPADRGVPAHPGQARRHGPRARQGRCCSPCTSAALKDGGHRLTPEQVSVGKLNNVREAIAIARECRTILGAAGITLEYPRHAARQQPRVGADLRGHLRGAPAGRRPGPDRHRRLRRRLTVPA